MRHLHLLAALAAAFLLVPAATASAGVEVPAEVVFAGEGSGWVKGTERIESGGEHSVGGEPRLECHWNGSEIDEGMNASLSGPEPGVHECKTLAQEAVPGLPYGNIEVNHEADAGSLFAGWKVLKALFKSCLQEDPGAGGCNAADKTEIKIQATFEPDGGGSPVALTIDYPGPGSGQVNCQVVGGELDEPCEASYPEGTELELVAAADPGSSFEGFENGTGDAAGCSASPCGPFTLGEASEVDAVFELEPPTLHTLTVTVTGEGEVSADTGTISGCTSAGGAACEGEYEEGATVTLTETAAPGSHFSGWGSPQCEESIEPTCEITLGSGDEGVSAGFEPDAVSGPPLTINIEAGEGTVVSNPAGLECSGSAGESCTTEEIEEGSVLLTASPAPGYLFMGWKRCDSGGVNGRQCTISLDEAKEVGARFAKTWELTIAKASGSGPGIAKTKPGGVVCLYACTTSTASYREGRAVEVTVKPAKHFHFVEFLGGTGQAEACDGHDEAEGCSYEPEGEDSSVEVLFEEDPKNALSLQKEGGGQGLVKTKPSGILCGNTCGAAEAEYYAAETVEVTVKLNKGTGSLTWTAGAGTCTGTVEAPESTCEVPMSASHELVAKFE